MIVTKKRLRERGLSDVEIAAIMDVYELADARLDLLRYHYGYDADGIPRKDPAPCMSPGKYGADCGECLRCMSIYTNGALKLK